MDIETNQPNEQSGQGTQLIPASQAPQPEMPSGKQKKKLSKQERKQLRKQQWEFEKQLVKEGKISPRYRYVPRNSFARILSVTLAFVFGVFAAFGTLVGGLAVVGTNTKLKDVMDTVGFDYSDYLTDAAVDKNLLDLVTEISNAEFTSLNDLAVYTPYIKNTLDDVNTQLTDIGVTLNVPELMGVNFENLGSYFSDSVIMAANIADILKVDKDDPEADTLMVALCYRNGEKTTIRDLAENATELINDVALADALGIKRDDPDADAIVLSICFKDDGEPTTIRDLTENASGLIGDVEIETLLSSNGKSDAVIRYLAYGPQTETDEDGVETLRYTIDEETGEVTMIAPFEKKRVKSLTEEDADIIEGARLGDIIEINENSAKFMQSLSDWTIGDLTDEDKIQSLKICEVIEINEDTSGLINSISGWTLSDMQNQNRINRLKIGQIITDKGNSNIMTVISDWRFEDLTDQSKIDSLTLGDVIKVNENSATILKSLKDTRLGNISDKIDSLTLSEILDDENGELSENKILKNLKNSTLKTLSRDVKSLTVEEVFGEELYSYLSIQDAKDDFAEAGCAIEGFGGTYAEIVKAYVDNNKDVQAYSHLRPNPVAVGEHEELIVDTRLEIGGNRVQQGYFLDGARLNEKVSSYRTEQSGSLVTVYYVEREIPVTPVHVWGIYDYDLGEAVTIAAGESVEEDENGTWYVTDAGRFEILSDDFGYYYEVEEKGEAVRIDMERITSHYVMDGTQYEANSSEDLIYGEQELRVYFDEENGYFVKLRNEAVESGYYYVSDGTRVVQEDESAIEERYFGTLKTAGGNEDLGELDRFLDGVWYLLFTREVDGEIITDTSTPILELVGPITDVSNQINKLPLWDLYLHGFIQQNPFQTLPKDFVDNGTTYRNLNRFTVSVIIRYVQAIINNPTTTL